MTSHEKAKDPVNAKKIILFACVCLVAACLLAILAMNLTLIIRGSLHSETAPHIFGIAPLTVESGSMEGDREDSFRKGALIFIRVLDEEEKQSLKTGDIVCFTTQDAQGNAIYVTHRIISDADRDANGRLQTVITMGDANNSADTPAVPLEDVFGVCVGHVNGLGDFAVFLQSPWGIALFAGVPILLFIAYDIFRIRGVRASQSAETSRDELREKEEEIARLRAMLGNSQSDGTEKKSGDTEAVTAENRGKNDSADASDAPIPPNG